MKSRITEAFGDEQNRFQRFVSIEVLYVDWHFNSFAMFQKGLAIRLQGANYVENFCRMVAFLSRRELDFPVHIKTGEPDSRPVSRLSDYRNSSGTAVLTFSCWQSCRA